MEYTHVSFDIADQKFKFYTSMDWHNLIANAREELIEEDEYWADAQVEELLEAMYGDELFWEEIV